MSTQCSVCTTCIVMWISWCTWNYFDVWHCTPMRDYSMSVSFVSFQCERIVIVWLLRMLSLNRMRNLLIITQDEFLKVGYDTRLAPYRWLSRPHRFTQREPNLRTHQTTNGGGISRNPSVLNEQILCVYCYAYLNIAGLGHRIVVQGLRN